MGWRQQTRSAIRAYPDLIRRERELKQSPIIAQYGGKIGGKQSGTGRGVEVAALRTLPRDEQRELDAVSAALQTTMRYRNGSLRIKIIDLVYWKGSHNLTGAALEVHVSHRTAAEWHRAFIELVDAYIRVL